MADAQPGALKVRGALALSLAGMGKDNVQRAAEALVRTGVRGLISFGTAGALTQELATGALAVSAEFVHPNANPVCDPASMRVAQRLGHRLGGRLVRLATVATPVGCLGERLALARATGADCVDLETHHIATVARQAGLPCIALRVILDDVYTDLPSGLTRQVDHYGRPKAGLVLWLFANPVRLFSLVSLARQLHLAQTTLRDVGQRLAGLIDDTDVASEVPPA